MWWLGHCVVGHCVVGHSVVGHCVVGHCVVGAQCGGYAMVVNVPNPAQIFTVTTAPFRSKLSQNSNRVASRLTTIASFPSVFFQLLQYSARQHPIFPAHWAALMTKTHLNYPAFSIGIVDFAVQFYSYFHQKRRSSQVWQWRDFPGPIRTNHNPLLRIATNGIASFCIDHRWRQMAFFVFVKMGKVPKAPLSRALRGNKAAFMSANFNSLLYKTNRFHVAVHLSRDVEMR